MKNPYIALLQQGIFGPLSKLVDPITLIIKRTTETEKLRVFTEYIIFSLDKEVISAEELVQRLSFLDSAFSKEIHERFVMWEDTGKRYQAIGGTSHYQIIIQHALTRLGLTYKEDLLLTTSQLREIATIIWH